MTIHDLCDRFNQCSVDLTIPILYLDDAHLVSVSYVYNDRMVVISYRCQTSMCMEGYSSKLYEPSIIWHTSSN